MTENRPRQGIDLYSLSADGRSLHTAVDFSISAIKDPSLIEKYTSETQNFSVANGLGWAEPYYQRFPKPELVEFIGHATLRSGALRIAPLLTLYFGA